MIIPGVKVEIQPLKAAMLTVPKPTKQAFPWSFPKKPISVVLDGREMGRVQRKKKTVEVGWGEETPPLSSVFSLSPISRARPKYENRLFSAENSTETLASQANSPQFPCHYRHVGLTSATWGERQNYRGSSGAFYGMYENRCFLIITRCLY